MALRSTQNVNIAVAGSTINHGLVGTPTEIFVLPTIAAGAGQTYRFSASTSAAVFLASGTAATSADVTCAVVHSIIS